MTTDTTTPTPLWKWVGNLFALAVLTLIAWWAVSAPTRPADPPPPTDIVVTTTAPAAVGG